FGVVVYPGFQALDAFGPLDILNTLALKQSISLSVIALTLDPISTKPPTMALPLGSNFAESIVPTHTFADPPKGLDVLIVPGGYGIRAESDSINGAVTFIKDVYPKLRHLFTVCTGSLLAARAGVLDGRNATTNKSAYNRVKTERPDVKWVPQARWVHDGNIWTSSGVSAGIDGMFAFLAATWGEDVAKELADELEYERHIDSAWDPFAELY
ncbi:DJ-1/PfpI family protein, partial [Peniophora sp. CONT]